MPETRAVLEKILVNPVYGQANSYTLHEIDNHIKMLGRRHKSVERNLHEHKPPNMVALME